MANLPKRNGARPMPEVREALAMANAFNDAEAQLYAFLVNVEGMELAAAKKFAREMRANASEGEARLRANGRG